MADIDAIQEIRENIIEIKLNIENFISNNDLKMKLIEEKIKVSNKRIEDLENTNKWLWRTIAGSLIGAAIAFYIKFN